MRKEITVSTGTHGKFDGIGRFAIVTSSWTPSQSTHVVPTMVGKIRIRFGDLVPAPAPSGPTIPVHPGAIWKVAPHMMATEPEKEKERSDTRTNITALRIAGRHARADCRSNSTLNN